MIFNKTEPRYASIDSTPASEINPLYAELRRLICLSTAAILLLSLASYSPTDPSWTTWSTRVQFHNWMGRIGAIIADSLFQLLGLCAIAVPAIPLSAGLRRTAQSRVPPRIRLLGQALFVFSLSALLQTTVKGDWIPWKLPHAGGITGRLTAYVLVFLAGTLGARLLSTFGLFASLILVFRWKGVSASGAWLRDLPARAKDLWGLLRTVFATMKSYAVSTLKRMRKPRVGLAPNPIQAVAIPNPLPLPTTSATPPVQTVMEITDAQGAVVDGPTVADPVTGLPKQKIARNRVHRGKKQDYRLPSLDLISGKAESKSKAVEKSWYLEKANILVQKLKDFGVEGEVVHISPGPVITVYEFKPASGVKIKEIANLSDDLTLALSVLSVRIVAPIPGKPVVGIEIPSPHREMVFFKDLIQETPFFKGDLKIPIALGRLASGEPLAADLASMPHLLIAGTTGTGKSVFINTLICSLLYRFSPEQLKLILVDPKMVELSHYDEIPHLLLPVVVDSKKAVLALRWAVDEMERRYSLMHQYGVRHIDAFNERIHEVRRNGGESADEVIPYIVVVIDEYADLMAVVPKEVELCIARLAQKARASGIHLVLATQRPSTDVVTGTIKANFPSRISFRVASSVDSKTILDRTGADRLLGHGDLLFHSAGFTTLKRMQGPFLSDQDTFRVVEFLKSQGAPEYDEDILARYEAEESEDDGGSLSGEEGSLYDSAVRLVRDKGEASISMVQRHLRIGYNRAASLIEQMEKEGIVGQAMGPAKRRTVISP